MADTYAASKQINQQLSNINAGGQALTTVDSLSTLKLFPHSFFILFFYYWLPLSQIRRPRRGQC